MGRSFLIDDSRPIAEEKFRKTGGALFVIWPNANAIALQLTDGSVAQVAYTKTGEQVAGHIVDEVLQRIAPIFMTDDS